MSSKTKFRDAEKIFRGYTDTDSSSINTTEI